MSPETMAWAAASKVEIGELARASESMCSTKSGQLGKPCARAMTNCASVSAHLEPVAPGQLLSGELLDLVGVRRNLTFVL